MSKKQSGELKCRTIRLGVRPAPVLRPCGLISCSAVVRFLGLYQCCVASTSPWSAVALINTNGVYFRRATSRMILIVTPARSMMAQRSRHCLTQKNRTLTWSDTVRFATCVGNKEINLSSRPRLSKSITRNPGRSHYPNPQPRGDRA